MDITREEVAILLAKANKNIVCSLLNLRSTVAVKRTACSDAYVTQVKEHRIQESCVDRRATEAVKLTLQIC
jgi:hypothetical protein